MAVDPAEDIMDVEEDLTGATIQAITTIVTTTLSATIVMAVMVAMHTIMDCFPEIITF